MSRAQGVVADAVGAVIAAHVHRELAAFGLPLAEDVVRAIGRSVVLQLRNDGWHMSPFPFQAVTAPETPGPHRNTRCP